MLTTTLGLGLYTYPEAARLTTLNPRRVRRWFEPSEQKSGSKLQVMQGDYGNEEIISFLDLIEVLVAGNLRELGLSMPLLRKARCSLKKYLQTEHPFSHRNLLTDGKNLFIHVQQEAKKSGELIDVVSLQHAIPQVLMPYLKRVDYDATNQLARQWNISDRVVIDPTRSFGKPIVQSCAIPTSILAAAFKANRRDADTVADWFGVAASDVQAAVRFETQYFGLTA